MTSQVLATPRFRGNVLSDTLPIVAAWAFVAALLLIQTLPQLIANGPIDPDSQMRLVEVRDYIAGQSWTDLTQVRLNPPDGVVLHWSRLIDWPLAMLIRLARPVVGYEAAEAFAISAWPLMLYLVYLIGIAAVARRLIGGSGVFPALAFAVFAAPATGMFVPGHITHHNAQIALFAILLAFAVRIDRGEIYGLLAGIVATIMLAIGLETLPLVAMVAFGLALTWAFAPAATRGGLNGFGLFFGIAMVVQRAFTAAPAHWLDTPCDIASAPYVAIALIGGLGLAGLARLNPASMTVRFAGIGMLGVAGAIAVALINPQCLKGPYAELDPRIIPLWLDHVEEAQSFGSLATKSPWLLIGLYLAPFLALVPTSWAFATADRASRAGWGLTLLLLMTAIAVSLWEARGATFSSVLVVPGMAYAVGEVKRLCTPRGGLVLAMGLLTIYTVPNQAAETIVSDLVRARLAPSANPQQQTTGRFQAAAKPFAQCAARDSFAGLAVEPAGLVLTESNLGPSVLLDTPHGTLAAPYHRNAIGLIDGLTALEASPERAHAIITRRHVAYVVTCPQDPEVDLIRETAPDGFLAGLVGGTVPNWLQPIASTGPLKLWRVVEPPPAGDPLPTGSIAAVRSKPPLSPSPVMQEMTPVVPMLRGTLPAPAR